MVYEIIRHIATLSTYRDENGERWARELNIVSWSGKDCVLDIRSWNEDHSKCNSGIRLLPVEIERLIDGYAAYKKEILHKP